MNLDEMNLEQVNQRLAELDEEVRGMTKVEDVEAATESKKALLERQAELFNLEQRKQTALDLAAGKIVGQKIEERKDVKQMENIIDHTSPEYRDAWLKNLQGKELNEIEKRALTATAAMPESTTNKIIDRMVDMVPLLNEIELFRIPGNLNIAVETAAPAGTQEAAGGSVTVATATLRQVALGGYNINAFIQVGADLAAMAVPAFEDWLVRKLSEGVAYKIEDMIVNGDGNSAPKGIESYVGWDVSDGTAIDWTGDTNTTLALVDIDKAISLIPAAYDSNSKFLMSKKTFFQNVSGLTDTNNWPIITKDGNKFYLRGYEVIFSDKVTLHDIFFGDFKRGMVGNLSSEIKVEKQRNLQYNAWDILGWGVFDCEPAAAGCIVKIASDIAA